MTERLTIGYENEGLAGILPRTGTVVAQFGDSIGNTDWLLLALDQSFDYQVKLDEPFRVRTMNVTHFLIRPRFVGRAIGAPERKSVFVLLVNDEAVPRVGSIDVKAYVFAAWGECRAATGA